MGTDYCDASERHWDDAELLMANTRLANADHLYGLCAECSLKAVMQALGMKVTETGPTEREHRKHIDDIWTEFITFANGRGGGHYVGLFNSLSNPFTDWRVSQRYEPRSFFVQRRVDNHRNGAATARKVLQEANNDGRIT